MLVILFALCIACSISWQFSTFYRSRLAGFPGPISRKFTDIFQFVDAFKGQTVKYLQECHQRYGKVVQIGPRTVSISDPAMIPLIYGIRNPLPKSHHWSVWENEFNGKLVPSVLYAQETSKHGMLKRPVAGVYSMSNVIKQEPFIDTTIVQFIKKLDQDFTVRGDEGKSVPIHSWMHYFAYDAVMKLTLSSDFGFIEAGGDREGIFSGVDAVLRYRAMVFTMPWIHSLVRRSPIVGLFKKRMAAFQRRARGLIDKRMTQGAPDPSRYDLLSQFLESQKASPQVVNDLVLNGYVVLPLLAGADTVAIVLGTLVYQLGQHVAVATKLQEELEAAKLSLPPAYAAVQGLPFLNAVVKESLRIHPIMAFLSRRVVPAGSGLKLPDGRILPPGTIVGISPWVTHFDEEAFGSDAKEFRPSRWLQEAEEPSAEYAKRLKAMNATDLAWGAGNRSCLGKNIALAEIYKLVATLYSLFDISLVDPSASLRFTETLLTKQQSINVRFSYRDSANVDALLDADKTS
ncbi:putative cytochrome P450 monooxygenase [Cucurbitaria berberidis CBS 394.84]|uniref:Cytochrome P450 monooxygenase n=1 Tax=Cucurbitaria berberidis CBS 394.84 TaxID=1168544 RepID=A0A9P4GL09_9PLEO|nr:putative cytochrome P450 monooxygenase [Cucurbitaria berberidis CBS 394.84]KAF1848283.1 putative cytochrome P450 monooxygenase [Cucurbitaria berberidis CBS 394.84]